MVPLTALWLPILLSAVIVFAASSVMHMLLKYHESDYSKLPEEEKVLAALRPFNLKEGLYIFPHCNHANMNSPEMVEKRKLGPVGWLKVWPSGDMSMARFLVGWVGYLLVIGVFTAYVTGRTVAPGANYLAVFRVAGTVSFMAYGLGSVPGAIWKGQGWGMTLKEVFDGLVFACLTAGVFGWLWVR
jgi:hypothetical protein